MNTQPVVLSLGLGHAGDIALAYPAVSALQAAGHRVGMLVNPIHRRPFGALDVEWRANMMGRYRVLTMGLDRSIHPARAWLDQAAKVIGAAPSYRARPVLPVTGAELAAAALPGRNWVLLAPAALRPFKAWSSVEGWAASARQALVAGFRVGVIGPACAHDMATAITASAPGAENLVGMDSPETWPAFVQRAAVVVAPDGGTMHVADLLGRRVVALFGPTDVRRWGPYWRNDFVVQSGNSRMDGIDPDDVADALGAALAEARAELAGDL